MASLSLGSFFPCLKAFKAQSLPLLINFNFFKTRTCSVAQADLDLSHLSFLPNAGIIDKIQYHAGQREWVLLWSGWLVCFYFVLFWLLVCLFGAEERNSERTSCTLAKRSTTELYL